MENISFVLLLVVIFFLALGNRRILGKKIRRFRRGSQKTTKVELLVFSTERGKQKPAKRFLQGFASVVDGDTVFIGNTSIRLFGIDAPELNHPFGNIAKQTLMSLCQGQKIRAELISQDTYGRNVARCYLQDGRDLSAEMVKRGLAIDWPKFSGGKYRSLETPDARKRLWLADARQKGRKHVWAQFEARQNMRTAID